MRATTLWRVTKPLFTVPARAHGSHQARRFIGYSLARCEPAKSSVAVASIPVEAAIPDAGAAASTTSPPEETDALPVDLKTVGAETSKVLTIADVLSRREAEFAQQESASQACFDEWESIPGTQTVQDAIDMMVECNMGSLIVTEETEGIVGIVTERDVLKKTSPRAIATDQSKHVKDIMSAQIMCIPPTTTVIDALATMTKENIRHLAVINGELNNAVKKGSVPEEAMRCVLSIKDIVRAYARFEAQKKKALEAQQQPLPPAEETTTTEVKVDAVPAENATPTTSTDATTTPKTEDTPSTTPVVTAATLLKKKHKKIKLILNTRVEDNVTVAEAVEEMARLNFGSVLVVDKDQRVLGIFTERDYLTKVLYPKLDPTQIKLTDICTKKLTFLQIEDSLEKCWNQFASQDFRHYPVIGTMRKDREKELAGVLSIKDIVREISKDHKPQSGFRLMEFFMSKIEKKESAPTTPTTPTTTTTPTAPTTPDATSTATTTTTTMANAST